jgi:hypothetical protein
MSDLQATSLDPTSNTAAGTTEATTAPQAPASPAETDAQGGGKLPEAEAKTFTQEQVNAIVATRLATEKAKNEKATEDARAKAKADALKEQGEFKTLYEETVAKLEQAEAARKELQVAGLRRDAGAKYKLPAALAERLRGETPEELEADAKALAATLPKPGAPNTNDLPAGGNGRATLSEADRLAMSSAIGIPAQYLK